MFYFIIALPIVSVVILAVFLGVYLNNKRYTSFVLKNSICLSSLKEINSDFIFYPDINNDQSYTYDNEKYFETISCDDFLIYQLQFQSKYIIDQIKKINYNKINYQKYINRIKQLRLGDFSAPIKNLKQKKLLKTEEKICNNTKLSSPTTQFYINVKLFCAKINGRIYTAKEKTFSAETILALINRLNNKSGTYYRDREIWDAICRVERGKVSNKLRFSIYARDGYRCRKCGISQRYATLEIDHIIPIAKGGKSTFDNLQTLCHNCNVAKGDKFEF